ncbi:MAG: nucleotidyltransferase domain-containing protein [Candidatus Omnitrophica bacterium]|nr:nucleotidyltransferase domain-containing protein [Candidatus Omnitrophota bacterium]
MTPINVLPGDLVTVWEILARQVPEFDIYAFGSRVRGNARKASDLDLVVMTDKPLDTLRMADLREAFSESDLPFKVDLVDWAVTKAGFRKLIRQNRCLIQTGRDRDKKSKRDE